MKALFVIPPTGGDLKFGIWSFGFGTRVLGFGIWDFRMA
jgi:hypothetical protein